MSKPRAKKPVTTTPIETQPPGEMRIEHVPLGWLLSHQAPRNPKKHDVDGVAASMSRFGFTIPVALDEQTNTVVAGHGRIEVLNTIKEAGKPAPGRVVVREDGEWLVPVLRGLSFANAVEAEAYLLADNRHTEVGGYDDTMLATMLSELAGEGVGLEGIGWDEREVADLCASISNATGGEEVVALPDEEPPEEEQELDESKLMQQVTSVAKLGDIWALGKHRIVCGDTGVDQTHAELLEGRVVDFICTDPPYAIFGSSNGLSSSIADDRMVVPFFEMVCRRAWAAVKYFGHVNLFCDWRSYPAVWEGLRRADLAPKNCLVWDKINAGLGSNYANSHEFIVHACKLPKREVMKGAAETGQRGVLASNMLRHARVHGDQRVHNASKPVPLVQQLIRNSTDPGEHVFDLFLGGGSTLMACELEDRVCSGIEINPRWVDVVIARWEGVTKQKARLVRNYLETPIASPTDTPT